jgi:hypothetical protein
VSWAWEYDPTEGYVVEGAPPAPVIEAEKKAAVMAGRAEQGLIMLLG